MRSTHANPSPQAAAEDYLTAQEVAQAKGYSGAPAFLRWLRKTHHQRYRPNGGRYLFAADEVAQWPRCERGRPRLYPKKS